MEYWKKNLYVLWGTQFVAMIGMNLVVPFLPFYIRELGVTNPDEVARWSGLVFAGPFLTAFIATPFWGSMGDKHGQKLMVVRAIFGLGLSQILVGFSQDVYQLLLFRMLQGAISGFIASALALVSTSTPKEHTGYSLGVLQSATAGGTMLGPAIGGFLADVIGYREIFFITAGLCFAGGFVIIKFVYEVRNLSENKKILKVSHNFRFMFTEKQLRIVAITIILSQLAALMIEPIFALFIETFKSTTKYVSTLTGITIAISGIFMVISSPWWGRRNDRLGYKQNLIIALTGTGVAYSLHMIVPGLITLGILRAALGFVRGGILHALYSLTSLRSPDERKSGMIGVALSLTVFGNMIGPLLGGMIAGNYGLTYVFVVNSAIFLATGLLVWRYLFDIRAAEHEKIA
ncbi:MAG: MFS transporter [Bacteroidota bacterium]|nr:MFS transporter [Bacteroidota bacterium]